MGLAFALDLNASCGSSGESGIAGNQYSEPFKNFTGKTGQNEITKIPPQIEISDDFLNIFFRVRHDPFFRIAIH